MSEPIEKFSSKIKKRGMWELREYAAGKLVAKGDLKFITERMLSIPGGQYGATHFMIPSGGYFKNMVS